MEHNQEIDPKLMERLRQLKAVPERDPQQMAKGRAQFLHQAQQIAAQGVSQRENYRHNMWKDTIQSIFAIKRKEQSHMFGVMTTLLLIFGMVLGGGGVTVAAAQSSLPDQALYPVKVWSENVRASLVTDPEAQFDLAFQFASRRTEEIHSMAEAGEAAPEAVMNQLQNQLEFALQVAANQPSDTGDQLLERARDRLRQQDQLMQQLETQASPEAEAALKQVRQMIQERLNEVEKELKNRSRFQKGPEADETLEQSTPEVSPDEIYPERNRTLTPASGEEHDQMDKTLTPASSHDEWDNLHETYTHSPDNSVEPLQTPHPDKSDKDHGSDDHGEEHGDDDSNNE